ncbi:hypothetical protein EDD85DRAFT_790761 [Armillaria nabsnona]|nr:hypothetical protein EDD85DRAFT_790761 [Armillaria nabsnona]
MVSGPVPLDPSYTADTALPPQWTSIDTEHTYRFGKGRARTGFWELTLVYVAAFNGASAVNFQHARANGLEDGNGSFPSRCYAIFALQARSCFSTSLQAYKPHLCSTLFPMAGVLGAHDWKDGIMAKLEYLGGVSVHACLRNIDISHNGLHVWTAIGLNILWGGHGVFPMNQKISLRDTASCRDLLGNTTSVTVRDNWPLTPSIIDSSSVMNPLSSCPDSCRKPHACCMRPKNQWLAKDFPRHRPQRASQSQVRDVRKIAGADHERHIWEQNPQRKKNWCQTFGPDKSEREQIWVCAKGRAGYRRKEESESWPSYTNGVLQSLLENLRKESDDVVLSALSMPYDEYKYLLYLAYPWLQEVEKTSESKPLGAPGTRTWSLKGPTFDQPAGIRCEAKSIDSPVHVEPGGHKEIRGLRCKLCIVSKNLNCNAWMRCWIGTRLFVDVHGPSLGKRKRPKFDSESEDDETGSEQSVAENDDEPVQRLRSGFVDFVRQLQSRITTLEQETDLLKQENAHLMQSVISLRAGNSALQNPVEPAVQQAEEEEHGR